MALAAKLEPPAFIPKPIYDYSFIGFYLSSNEYFIIRRILPVVGLGRLMGICLICIVLPTSDMTLGKSTIEYNFRPSSELIGPIFDT